MEPVISEKSIEESFLIKLKQDESYCKRGKSTESMRVWLKTTLLKEGLAPATNEEYLFAP